MRVIYDIYSNYNLLVEGTPSELSTFHRMLSNARITSNSDKDGNIHLSEQFKPQFRANLVADTAEVIDAVPQVEYVPPHPNP